MADSTDWGSDSHYLLGLLAGSTPGHWLLYFASFLSQDLCTGCCLHLECPPLHVASCQFQLRGALLPYKIRKIPWRREWQPTPVFLPGEFHGQRRLVVLDSIPTPQHPLSLTCFKIKQDTC